jgi:hypothetical protein
LSADWPYIITFCAIMGFNDLFRLSVHAVITNPANHVLLLKQTYGDGR